MIPQSERDNQTGSFAISSAVISMPCEYDDLDDPFRLKRLFGEFSKDVPVPLDNLSSKSHLLFESRVIGGKTHAPRGLRKVENIALSDMHATQHVGGKNHANGVADFSKLEGGYKRNLRIRMTPRRIRIL